MSLTEPQQRYQEPVARRYPPRHDDDGGDGGGRRKLWPLWAMLGAFALACGLALLLSASNDDDDRSGARQGSQQSPQQQGATGSGAPGTLTAGGQGIVPGQGAALGDQVGQRAEGRDVIVQSVAGDSGFFVGPSAQDRVYVEWSTKVGEAEANFAPKAGERVNLSGPVRPAPENPADTLKLGPEDAKVVSDQRAFVNAEDVQRVGG